MTNIRPGFTLALTFLVLTALYPTACRGANQDSSGEGVVRTYRSYFGVAFKNIELDISDTDTEKTVALLQGDYIPWPYVSVRSPTRYFEESRVGWLVEYGLGGFHIDKQADPFTETGTDLGTNAEGWFLYAVPTLTWDALPHLKVGLGLGAGILSLKGDALIYDPFPAVTKIDYSLTQLAYGGYFLTEYFFGNFMIGVHAGVLIATKKPYDYSISDGSVILAYTVRY